MIISQLVGGDIVTLLDGTRYLVLERYSDLPVSVACLKTGRVLLATDVIIEKPVTKMCLWGAQSACFHE